MMLPILAGGQLIQSRLDGMGLAVPALADKKVLPGD